MGDTIWVDVEGRGPGELPADNSIILRLEKNLAKLSSKLNVPKLADFYAYESGWFQKRRWFDPARALATITALHDHLEQNPGDLGFEPDASRQHWPGMLMTELVECRRALDDAVAKGKRFRFLIVS
jgi:hypothetical protein